MIVIRSEGQGGRSDLDEDFRTLINASAMHGAAIAARIFRLANGLLGDVSPVGQGVSELRIHYGPGYRVYFQQRGEEIGAFTEGT